MTNLGTIHGEVEAFFNGEVPSNKQTSRTQTSFAVYRCNHLLNFLRAHTYTIASTSPETKINGKEPMTYDIHFVDK